MKLCAVSKQLPYEHLYNSGYYLYFIPENDYKKEILKGNVILCDNEEHAWICYEYIYSIGKRNIPTVLIPYLEELISNIGYYSYWYATDVLDGRFELGEEAINKSGHYSSEYRIFLSNQ